MNLMFEPLVPFIQYRVDEHHKLYSSPCKGELWEENLCWALKQAGFGSDWKPDSNHKVGLDQTTDDGTRIGNKSGKIVKNKLSFSGSRLTKHKTFLDKLEFLSLKKEDYVFCLARKDSEWKKGIKRYYFIVINSDILNYHEQEWEETYGKKANIGSHVGWECFSEVFDATITKAKSDQLWTKIKLDYCEEIYEITVRQLSESFTNT